MISDLTEQPAAASYADPARFDAENCKTFRKLPLLAGLTRDVPNPGETTGNMSSLRVTARALAPPSARRWTTGASWQEFSGPQQDGAR